VRTPEPIEWDEAAEEAAAAERASARARDPDDAARIAH
jgi:ATP-dependent Lon protease